MNKKQKTIMFLLILCVVLLLIVDLMPERRTAYIIQVFPTGSPQSVAPASPSRPSDGIWFCSLPYKCY